ncbi:MAG: TonB-dependent receptor [Gammaproteobacteria bacterium]|jgi:outer membrane receptor protein involved in Fe transport|nr:TonB-dependent receptor [Gammaproteobacteria bacterium]
MQPIARIVVAACVLLPGAAGAAAVPPDTLIVTARRAPILSMDLAQNVARVGDDAIDLTAATHPYEIAVRIPGAWISRGSGQEQLTAIRSPVLTGPGSCGAFLQLEDGIPIRPVGFCNVNQLFEVPTEFARAIEVVRGPATADFGSNGLHGTINTLLPEPDGEPLATAMLEAGSNEFWRGRLQLATGAGRHAATGGVLVDSDGGYRDASGYQQFKAYAKTRHELAGGVLLGSITVSELDQETAGFVVGFDAYKDPALRYSNPNPEAYRRAGSRRAALRWLPESAGAWQTELRLFARNSDMNFLQHFLPGQPVEENGQTSGGMMLASRRSLAGGGEVTAGVDLEIARGWLEEFQENPTEGSAFLQATRPVGQHYDYEVDSYMAATFANARWVPGADWEVQAGLRAEYLVYDYDNRMLDGNTRDTGEPCGFGGCLFTRPADRRDSFFNLAPNVGLLYRLSPQTVGFANLTRGFRAPQATELYRLQSGQQTADIRAEQLDSLEVGVRRRTERLSMELVAYTMRKRNFIFRDAAGFNVSDGKTAHRGIEANLEWQISLPVYAGFTGSFARQTYRFDRDAGLGEVINSGNRIDTTPQILASARLGYRGARGHAELEWAYNDAYFLDAANTARYPGHYLLNARMRLDINRHWSLGLRLTNLTDVVYADRADLFSLPDPAEFRYFPGRRREIFGSISWRY